MSSMEFTCRQFMTCEQNNFFIFSLASFLSSFSILLYYNNFSISDMLINLWSKCSFLVDHLCSNIVFLCSELECSISILESNVYCTCLNFVFMVLIHFLNCWLQDLVDRLLALLSDEQSMPIFSAYGLYIFASNYCIFQCSILDSHAFQLCSSH